MKSNEERELRAFLDAPDEASFRPVFESSRGLVYTLCLRRLGDESDALDAFQSVYCRLLLLARKGAPPNEDLGRLIPRLALREADSLRKRRARRVRKERAMASRRKDLGERQSADTDVSLEQLRNALERLVDNLPEKLRLPLQLHYFHGLSHRDVARALNESASTISYRIRAGLQRLERPARRAGLGPVSTRLASLAGLAALFRPRRTAAAVFENALSVATECAASSALPTAMPGATKASLFAVAGTLLVVASVTLLWFSGGDEPDSPLASRATATTSRVTNDGSRGEATGERPGRSDTAGGTPSPAPERVASRTLALRVLWAIDDAPVEGARVEARWENAASEAVSPPGEQELEESGIASTDATGEAIVAISGSTGPWRIDVSHPEAKAQSLRITVDGDRLRSDGAEIDPAAPLTLRLETAFVVTGSVRGSRTDVPIAGARLRTRYPAPGEVLAESNEAGEFRIAGLEPGDLELVASAEGYAPRPYVLTLKEERVHYLDIALDPATIYTVTVVDEMNAPIAGAKVFPSRYGCDGCYHGDRFVVADETGTAVLEDVSRFSPPNVKVEKAGYKTASLASATRTPSGFTARVVLTEKPTYRYVITGTIRDPAGRPIPDIKVEYKDGHGTRFADDAVYGEHFGLSDHGGHYRLEFEDDFEYCHLGVGGQGWAPQVRRQVPAGHDGEPVVMDFELEPAHWLEGVVVDEDGKPLSGVEVSAMPTAETLNTGRAYPVVFRKTTTDEQGRFRLDDLAGPTTAVRLRGPRGGAYPSRDLPEVAVGRHVELELRRWGVIQGRTFDAQTGDPITEFNIKIQGSIWVRRADPGEAFSSADGSFVLENLTKDETFGILVEAEGYLPARVDELTPVDPSADESVRVELDRGRELRLQVVDAATGAAIARARVSYGEPVHGHLNVDAMAWNAIHLRRVFHNFQRGQTDAEGWFSCLEGKPGLIFIEAEGYQRRHVGPEERDALKIGGGALRIELGSGASIRGRVVLGGKPATNTDIQLLRDARAVTPPTREAGDELRTVQTDGVGEFALDGVEAGKYGLELRTRGGSGGQYAIYRRSLEVPQEGLDDLTIGESSGTFTLHGNLLEPDGSLPLSATLRLRPRSQGEFSEFRTTVSRFTESSLYSIPCLRAGAYDVDVMTIRDGGWKVLSLGTIEIVADTQRDLTLP